MDDPSQSTATGSSSSNGLANQVYNRLLEIEQLDAIRNPFLLEILKSHFARLPHSYALGVDMQRVEDVVLHLWLLSEAKLPEVNYAFRTRFLERIIIKSDVSLQLRSNVHKQRQHDGDNRDEEPHATPRKRTRDDAPKLEPCPEMGDPNLDASENIGGVDKFPKRQELTLPIHEVIFATFDKLKLLNKLPALLSDIRLNIREAHIFSTNDGYSLGIFVVDGWQEEDTTYLNEAIRNAIRRSEDAESVNEAMAKAIQRSEALATQAYGDQEIDLTMLKIGREIRLGSFGHLFHGTYYGQDVVIKIEPQHLNRAPADKFAQEIMMLREAQHRNVVRLIGAWTKSPHWCIVTEYIPGGSLYDYIHKHHGSLSLLKLLSFAIDISKGMGYLHRKNIIHRDLRTLNLMLDGEEVIKIADFGCARFQPQGEIMTEQSGSYRWMAPEIVNRQPYDQRADVYSFAIVIWELFTAKTPYPDLPPLKAARRVTRGLRPWIPQGMHLTLIELMTRCWDEDPAQRPPFSEITMRLEALLREIQEAEA